MRGLVLVHPALLVLLLLAPAAWLAWRRWPPPLGRRQSRFVLVLRLVVVVLLVLALAGLRVTRQPAARAVVAVVDLSDSASGTTDDAAAAVRALVKAKGPDDLFGVVTFGRDAHVEVAPSRNPLFDGFQAKPDPTYSDLGGGLELAANLIPEGYGRQLVLLSDGRQNLGDASEVVGRLRARATRVDVLPLGAAPGPEAMVAALDAPAQVREGQTVTVTARVRSNAPVTGTVALQVDGRQVATVDASAPPGTSGRSFTVPPLAPGLHRLRAVLDARPDGRSENNVAEAVVRVLGKPAVLVLEGAPGGGANVAAALGAAGMRADTRPAEQTPVDPAALAAYDGIVVADAPADAFPDKALPAIAATVSDAGRGLVAIGGSTAYGPGGWQGTSLEKALPVRMELPRRKEKPALAVVVVLETMEYPAGDQVELGALQSVLDQLGPEDEVGVVSMQNGAPFLTVPLSPVVDKPGVLRRAVAAELGDPSGYGPSLTMALDALAPSAAATKHVLVVGDGDADADAFRYPPLLARAPEVTVSVVGDDADRSQPKNQHNREQSNQGGGRYYQAEDATDVPEILLKASKTALRPWFEQDPFFPTVTSSGDLLQGVPLDAFPPLGGYVVATAKGEAEVALTSPKGDPVLASWTYGLGRAVAWTSDARGRWTRDLLASPVGAALFARMVAWSLPGAPPDGLTIETVPAGDGLDVTVTGAERGGEVDVTALAPDLTATAAQLRVTQPGRWEGRLTASQLGTYIVRAQVRRGGSALAQGETLVTVPYSPEYLEQGRDDGLLRRISRQGGSLLAAAPAAWSKPLPPLSVSSDIFFLLLVAAAVLWPIEVAARRLNLTPRGVAGLVRAVVTFRRPKDIEVVVPAGLSRLKERIDTHRLGHPPAPADAAPIPAPPEPSAPASRVPPEPRLPVASPPADEPVSGRLLAAKRRRHAAAEEDGG